MAKKAAFKNMPPLQGVSIFKNGLLPAQPSPEKPGEASAAPVQPVSAAQTSGVRAQPAADRAQQSAQKKQVMEEKKMLRSYHLPASLIQKLEDAHMVYQIKRGEKKDKQDIVIDALTRYFDALDQQGFFDVLNTLRS